MAAGCNPSTSTADRGQVVGLIEIAGGDLSHPFLWQDGRLVDLLAGQPETHGSASDINNAGEIVGSVSSVGAVLWRDGRRIELGVDGSPRWINERGVIAGGLYTPVGSSDYKAQVYRWHRGRLLLSAPVIGAEVSMGITGIDDQGRIVGRIDDPVLGHRLVAWTL